MSATVDILPSFLLLILFLFFIASKLSVSFWHDNLPCAVPHNYVNNLNRMRRKIALSLHDAAFSILIIYKLRVQEGLVGCLYQISII